MQVAVVERIAPAHGQCLQLETNTPPRSSLAGQIQNLGIGRVIALSMVEETIRVPLVLSGPDVRAQRRGEFVDHLDLFRTLVDYAGIRVQDGAFAGRTCLPLLHGGRDPQWRDAQFCEFGDMQMIRTLRFKLVRAMSRRAPLSSIKVAGNRRTGLVFERSDPVREL